MWVDSHCHLSQLKLEKEQSLESELIRANQRKVNAFLCVATDIENTIHIQSLCKKLSNVWTTAGVHPLYPQSNSGWKNELGILAQNENCIAIGETGLDYHYVTDNEEQKQQRESFDYHISLSKSINKPLIIHTRAARSDTLDLLSNAKFSDNPGVIHCFTEDWAMAQKFLDLGFYISFSGIVTFKNSQDIREAMNKMPLERLLIETDSPYLAPVPHRGKPNTPAYVVDIGNFIAAQRGIDVEELAYITSNNFTDLFRVQTN